jgi:hypothetical protein
VRRVLIPLVAAACITGLPAVARWFSRHTSTQVHRINQ